MFSYADLSVNTDRFDLFEPRKPVSRTIVHIYEPWKLTEERCVYLSLRKVQVAVKTILSGDRRFVTHEVSIHQAIDQKAVVFPLEVFDIGNVTKVTLVNCTNLLKDPDVEAKIANLPQLKVIEIESTRPGSNKPLLPMWLSKIQSLRRLYLKGHLSESLIPKPLLDSSHFMINLVGTF